MPKRRDKRVDNADIRPILAQYAEPFGWTA
jgi:hypothetical protein